MFLFTAFSAWGHGISELQAQKRRRAGVVWFSSVGTLFSCGIISGIVLQMCRWCSKHVLFLFRSGRLFGLWVIWRLFRQAGVGRSRPDAREDAFKQRIGDFLRALARSLTGACAISPGTFFLHSLPHKSGEHALAQRGWSFAVVRFPWHSACRGLVVVDFSRT